MTTTLEETVDIPETREGEATLRRSMRERIAGLSGRDRFLMGAGVGVAVVAWILGSVLTGGGASPAQESVTQASNSQPSPPEPQVELTPAEYLDLGRGAIKDGRLLHARRHIERALASHPTDRGVRAALCRMMADVCHRMGQPDAAELYREEAASFMSVLDGNALLVFQRAEADLAAGDVRGARRRYHAIALGGGQAGGGASHLRAEVDRRLARTYEAEFKAPRKSQLDQIFDPVLFGRGGHR